MRVIVAVWTLTLTSLWAVSQMLQAAHQLHANWDLLHNIYYTLKNRPDSLCSSLGLVWSRVPEHHLMVEEAYDDEQPYYFLTG